jgi:hypothetical protein
VINADSVTVANDPPFSLGVETLQLSDLIVVSGDLYRWPATWDLNAGLSGQLGDGMRSVFVRLSNQQGLQSEVTQASVFLDTTPPIVSGVNLVREPFFAPADDALEGTVFFSATDPFTNEPVTIRVLVFSNEELSGRPTLTATGPEVIEFSDDGSSGQIARFAYQFDPADRPAEGVYLLTITWQDWLGNGGTHDINSPFIVIDETPPDPLALDRDKILYRRAPWGSRRTAGERRFSLEAEVGAVAVPQGPIWTVIAYLDQQADPGDQVGFSEVNSDGSFTVEDLVSGDASVVYLCLVDRAGVKSQPVGVREIEWTATLNRKVAYSDIENPHVFTNLKWFTTELVQPNATQAGALDGLDAIGSPWVRVARDGTWRKLPVVAGSPPARHSHAMVYDSARGVTVLYDGYCGCGGDTWEYNGVEWKLRTPNDPEGDGNPPSFSRHAMAYDGRRGVVVLFGGDAENEADEDQTWEWDGSSWAFRLPADPEGDGNPFARSYHQMAYDPDRSVVMLFGGSIAGAEADGAIWEWNGRSWAIRVPGDVEGDGSPRRLQSHALAHDSARDVAVLFGGQVIGVGIFGDTWELDGESWILRVPDDPEGDGDPAPRYKHSIVYDQRREKVVLFGGRSGATVFDDTWEWDGNSWALRTPMDPEGDGNPSPRENLDMVYDRARGVVVLFGGGVGQSEYNGETWEWNGYSWAYRLPSDPEGDGSPRPLYRHQMVFDSTRNVTVLFGGKFGDVDPSDAESGETWEWNGADWTFAFHFDPEGDGNPSRRCDHAMVYDARRGITVLFGGYTANNEDNGDTWLWNGWSWELCLPTDPEGDGNPQPMSRHAMAYDEEREVVVLFADDPNVTSTDLGLTWEWDGSSWALRSPQDPEGDGNPFWRGEQAMAFDGTRGVIVLHSGASPVDNLGNTWEWDGNSWALRTPADPEGDGDPGFLWDHTMTYDDEKGSVVLFGGFRQADRPWQWDGTSWMKSSPADPELDGEPPKLSEHAMAFDQERGVAVVFGGEVSDYSYSNQTWEWNGGASSGPAQILQVIFGEADMAADLEFKEISLSWYAGGAGYPTPDYTAVNGVELLVWDRGEWRWLASGSSGPDSPTEIQWTTTDTQQLSYLFFGPRRTLNFAVTPTEPNGCGNRYGEISTDYVEVVVRYTRQ